MGLFEPEDWKAKWIGLDEAEEPALADDHRRLPGPNAPTRKFRSEGAPAGYHVALWFGILRALFDNGRKSTIA